MTDKAARQLINWNAEVTIDGDKTTLHDWLGQNYKDMSDGDIARILERNGVTASGNAVRHHRRNHGWLKKSGQAYVLPIDTTVIESEEVEESASEAEALLLKAIKNTPRSVSELSEILDRSESSISEMLEALRDKSYNIIEAGEKHRLDTASVTSPPPLPQTLADQVGHHIRFGIASDLHTGSKAQQITNLHRFIQDIYEQGIRHIFVPGDLTAGMGVYRGQINDLYATSADTQLTALDWLLPKLDGLVYYTIGGNHDYAYVKLSGYNIVAAFAAMREDVVYLGFDMADVPVTDQVDVRLWHPSGGVPYAVCLDEESEILTMRGWVGCDTISMSDKVATLNPEGGELEYQRPQELFVQHYKGPMVHISSRTVDHLVTPQHDLWLRPYNEGREDGEWRKVPAGDVAKHTRRQEWQMTMLAKWKGGRERETYSVPFHNWSGARDLGEMPMDAFLEFLGWYISEGHTQAGKLVAITNTDLAEVERIKSCMAAIGLNVKVYQENRDGYKTVYRVRGHNASLVRWLKAEAGKGAYNKKAPRFIMGLSGRQIRIFLSALFAGDGTKDGKGGYITYNSVSKQLRDDVQELLLKVGSAGTVGSGTVGVLRQSTPTINSVPKIIEYDGLIWCARVPNGLVYARRNGKPVWTGNSYRLQKGMQQMAYAALAKAIETGENPRMRIVLSGHLHVSMTMQRGPIMGLQCGCFEGQTNYLKRKALFPQVGGYIIELWLTDGGLIQRVRHEWVPFLEIENDFLNYPNLLEQLHGGVKDSRAGVVPLFAWEDDDS